MKRILVVVLAALFIFASFAMSEEIYDTVEMTVTARLLNGRDRPSKKGIIEAVFDRGDTVKAYDWSENHHWIEVEGGESGSVWVWWSYLTERTDEFAVWNNWGAKVKIRKEPYGRVIGYLEKDKETFIDQVVLGWGHCPKGWIDLKYLTEED